MPHGPHVQRAAPAHDQVGRTDQFGGERGGEAAAHVQVPRAAAEQAPGRCRRGQQRTAGVGEPLQVRPGLRDPRPPPGHEHRPLGQGQLAGQGVRRVRGGRDRPEYRPGRRWLPVAVAGLHVEGHGQDHRAPLRGGRVVGPRGVGGGRGGGVEPFRHRAHRRGQRGHVDAEVGPDRRGGHVRGEHHQRRPALGRLGDAGDRVGQPGTLVHAEQAGPSRGPGPPVGHAGRAALMPGGDVPGSLADQGVGEVEVAAADHAEHGVRAQPGQRRGDSIGDPHQIKRARLGARRAARRGRWPGTGCPSRR